MNRYGYGMVGGSMPVADRGMSVPESYLDMVRMQNSGVPAPKMMASSLRPGAGFGEAVMWTGEQLVDEAADYWKRKYMELVGDGGDSADQPSNLESAPSGTVGAYMGTQMDNEIRRREEIRKLLESEGI